MHLATGHVSHACSVLISTGVSYRRLKAPSLDALLGAGIFNGATGSESRAFAGEHVYIAGGANSAGQAAVNTQIPAAPKPSRPQLWSCSSVPCYIPAGSRHKSAASRG